MATEITPSSIPHDQMHQLPQLQSLQKAMAFPSVGAAVDQIGMFYTKVKGAHALLDWALSTAEMGVSLAANTAAPYVATPLAVGDAKFAAAIDELERRVPLVTEQPSVIIETTKNAFISRISPHVNKVCVARASAEKHVKSLKDLSWAKANSLLSTAYGQKAMYSVDNGATYAMQLLDHYLPALEQQEENNGEIVPATSDPTLHTVQTVGRLSSVAARRVWANLAYKVNELKNSGIELDVRRYVTALLAALHLAHVTSRQQQQEQAQEQQAQAQEEQRTSSSTEESCPINRDLLENAQNTAPTTTTKLKSTPEGKSNKKPESQ